MTDVEGRASAAPRVIRNHRRFALSDVTFDGQPVGGATVDAWQDGVGTDYWSARVLMGLGEGRLAGALAGRTRDGRLLHGRVAMSGPATTPRVRGEMLVEWRGVGPLLDTDVAASND